MTGVAVGQPAVGLQRSVHQCDEPRFDAALVEREVDARDCLARRVARGGLRGENALHHRAQQRGRRPLSRDVAEREAKGAAGQIHVVVKVAADGSARNRCGREAEECADAPAFRQKRLLDVSGDPHLLLHLRLLHRLAIEPRIFNGHGRFGGKRLERAASGAREEAALFTAVEIQHADPAFLRHGVRLRVDVADKFQRHALHVADAQRDGPHVDIGEIAIQQVRENLRLACPEYFFRNLPAGCEARSRQHLLAAAARHLEFELPGCGARQHDEAALRSTDLDRRIEHQREYIVEHPAAPQRAKAVEQRRDLAQISNRGGRRLVLGRSTVGEEKHKLGSARPPEANAISVHKRPLFADRFVIDVRAITRLLVADHEAALPGNDLRMVARHLASREPEIVRLAASDAESLFGDRDDAPAERVGDFEACVWHGGSLSKTANGRGKAGGGSEGLAPA